jgi:hypothetical protein
MTFAAISSAAPPLLQRWLGTSRSNLLGGVVDTFRTLAIAGELDSMLSNQANLL